MLTGSLEKTLNNLIIFSIDFVPVVPAEYKCSDLGSRLELACFLSLNLLTSTTFSAESQHIYSLYGMRHQPCQPY